MTSFRARSRELEVGEALGPYRLEELLAKGGMGLVFRAVREADGQVVALKVLLRALSEDATFQRRFAHEARAAAQVSHRNLVPILDAGECDGLQYLAMTYVPGPTLEDRIRGSAPLTLDELLELAADVGAGLDALHARGIAHRDVKPSNVLFDDDGRALLTDFGLAKGHGYTALTAPGQVMGTLHYVAPELIRGEPATPATDLYALGCVIYEATTGAPPFAAADPVDIGVGHLRREPPDPRTRRVDLSPALAGALLRALAKDPEHRPASGADYARGLRAAASIATAPQDAGATGAELGGYAIVRKLGHGASGSVWEARHLRLGHRAAIKVLDSAGGREDRDRFVLESRLVAAIEHPSIIPIYDSGEADGVLYIAMRYVDGGDLAELVRRAGALEPAHALGILEQVAAALDAVHARGLVHSDVKPANILVDEAGGRAFLGDFGIAHRPRARRGGDAPRFAGTLGYAAPEQLDGKPAGPAADVYALGCVLYECLTGRRPFARDNDVAVLYAHLLDPPPRVADARPELPVALDAVFARALAKTSDARFATCGELIEAARAASGIATVDRAGGAGRPAPRDAPRAAAPRLPRPARPLVGRDRELEALEGLLSTQGTRLVTLTGPGGCGKTLLAVEAAHAVQERFRDGVILVALDTVGDVSRVPQAIAVALGLEERATPDRDALIRGLVRALEPSELLLVLDGFERVLPAAPLVAELLGATTGLRLLVTSQAALRLQGEHELPVPPLELDAAVQLFVDRARAVHPGFTLAGDNAGAVAEICRRLDGLPLAVELAAARTKLLSPRAIVDRLENRLELLTGGARDLPARHHTLRGAIDWTHELLDADEQAAFACLAVFEDGFRPEDAEAVCDQDLRARVLDVLASLVDKSLLMRRERGHGEPRLEMLQTIREYARYRLIERGDRDEVRRRHAERFLAVAESAELSLLGPDQAAVVQRLEDDTGNVRAALAWSLESGQLELGLRMAAALARFWSIRDQLTEGRAWLRQALARGGSVEPRVRARGLFAAAYCALSQGDYVDAATGFEQSLETYRMLDDRRGQATCLAQIAWLLLARGQLEQATAAATRALELARSEGDEGTASVALADLAEVALRAGDHERATELFGEVLVLRRGLGDRRNVANALVNLGRAQFLAGDVSAAAAGLEDALALAREVGDTWGTSLAQISLARVALEREDAAAARRLATQALASCRARGDRRTAAECLSLIALLAADGGRPEDAAALRAAAAALRAQMGAPANPMERALEARPLSAAGGETARDALGFEQAVELALSSCAVLEP